MNHGSIRRFVGEEFPAEIEAVTRSERCHRRSWPRTIGLAQACFGRVHRQRRFTAGAGRMTFVSGGAERDYRHNAHYGQRENDGWEYESFAILDVHRRSTTFVVSESR